MSFRNLNDVYLAFLNQSDPAAVNEWVPPTVWMTAAEAGLYGVSLDYPTGPTSLIEAQPEGVEAVREQPARG